jgi:hypothetical protein
VTNFQNGTAAVDGFLAQFHVGNGAGAEINIAGHETFVTVQTGNVDYTIEGIFVRIEDGTGNSDFHLVDTSMVIIDDGAGNDTVYVDDDSTMFYIESGEGHDVYVIEEGAQGEVANFDPGSDTIIFDGQEVAVTADGYIDPGMLVYVDVADALI